MTTQDKIARDKTARDGAVRRRAAGFACLVLLMVAGCAQQPDQETVSVTPELSLSGAASPRPAVSEPRSVSARDQQIAAGAEAIRAYRQMIFDIYADPSPNVQDMRKVATGQLLAKDIAGLHKDLAYGLTATEGAVDIKWVRPVRVRAEEMRLYACVSPKSIQAGRNGRSMTAAPSEAVDYVVERRGNRWLVAGLRTHDEAGGIDSC